jgi:hypothetical protein
MGEHGLQPALFLGELTLQLLHYLHLDLGLRRALVRYSMRTKKFNSINICSNFRQCVQKVAQSKRIACVVQPLDLPRQKFFRWKYKIYFELIFWSS